MNRHDMFVELVTDQINSIEQMIRDDEYGDVHHWLHPILLRELKLDYADWTDEQLQDYYNDQLGVDTPSSPPLSSTDEEETEELIEACFGKDLSQETANSRAVPQPSEMERRSLSSIYPVSDAKGLAEVAASIRDLARGEENIYRIEPTTEIRIPMRLLFRLVHGKGSLC